VVKYSQSEQPQLGLQRILMMWSFNAISYMVYEKRHCMQNFNQTFLVLKGEYFSPNLIKVLWDLSYEVRCWSVWSFKAMTFMVVWEQALHWKLEPELLCQKGPWTPRASDIALHNSATLYHAGGISSPFSKNCGHFQSRILQEQKRKITRESV